MAQALSKISIRINASALTGRLTDCHYTQGAALGYALVGLSARFGTKSETLVYIYCYSVKLFHLLQIRVDIYRDFASLGCFGLANLQPWQTLSFYPTAKSFLPFVPFVYNVTKRLGIRVKETLRDKE